MTKQQIPSWIKVIGKYIETDDETILSDWGFEGIEPSDLKDEEMMETLKRVAEENGTYFRRSSEEAYSHD